VKRKGHPLKGVRVENSTERREFDYERELLLRHIHQLGHDGMSESH